MLRAVDVEPPARALVSRFAAALRAALVRGQASLAVHGAAMRAALHGALPPLIPAINALLHHHLPALAGRRLGPDLGSGGLPARLRHRPAPRSPACALPRGRASRRG